MPLTQKKLDEIKEKAVFLDWNVAFNGKSKGNQHLFRVHKIAQYLCEKEGGDKMIVISTAWTHDVSLASGNDNDPETIYRETLKFLKPFRLGKDAEVIAKAASDHEESQSSSIESKIVHDADTLDKSGIMGIIRHIWKMTNLIENRVLDSEDDLENLRNALEKRQQKLFTKTAKQLLREINRDQDIFFKSSEAVTMMCTFSSQANKGVISDKIAERFIKESSNSKITTLLKTQLECTYLSNKF